MFYDMFVELCKERNVSASFVMKEIGLNKSNATFWKRGSIPKGDTLQKLAQYFNVSVDYLLGKEEVEEKAEHEFQKACEYLEEAGFTLDQDEKDHERGVYQICHFDHGTVTTKSQAEIVALVQGIVEDSISIQEEYISRRLKIELLTGL